MIHNRFVFCSYFQMMVRLTVYFLYKLVCQFMNLNSLVLERMNSFIVPLFELFGSFFHCMLVVLAAICLSMLFCLSVEMMNDYTCC